MHIYPGTFTPSQLHLELQNVTTSNNFHIKKNAHIPRADVPPPNCTRATKCDYIKKLSHKEECTYTQGRCTPQSNLQLQNVTTLNYRMQLHQITFTYRRMYIYPGHMYPLLIALELQNVTTSNNFHI